MREVLNMLEQSLYQQHVFWWKVENQGIKGYNVLAANKKENGHSQSSFKKWKTLRF